MEATKHSSISTSTSIKNSLINKIENMTAKVCIVGLGYVGLPLAVESAKVGYHILGIENNTHRCKMINAGMNYIKDVKNDELTALVNRGMIKASSGFEYIQEADVVIICVPTPLNKNKEPDISYIKHVTNEISKNI